MNPDGFLADVADCPGSLAHLGERIAGGGLPLEQVGPVQDELVLLLGMGSSAYAAAAVAARLRSVGVHAVAELASCALLPPPEPRTVVVAVSAGGRSDQTVQAAARYAGRSRLLAVTEVPGSPVTAGADLVLPLLAGPEPGGISCRSYRHTIAVLLAVADRLRPGCAAAVPAACAAAATATADLLDTRRDWVGDVADLLTGPDGMWVLGPAERLASAQQSALMIREGPRRPAHHAETADWSHVDVYLTATLDYRMLLLPGSRWDQDVLDWAARREVTVVTAGPALPSAQPAGAPVPIAPEAPAAAPGTAAQFRPAAHVAVGSADPDVALLAETTVAELLAHHWWSRPG